jgi:hypothetical protein
MIKRICYEGEDILLVCRATLDGRGRVAAAFAPALSVVNLPVRRRHIRNHCLARTRTAIQCIPLSAVLGA